MQLDLNLLRQFGQDGYIVIDDLISDRELKAIIGHADAMISTAPPPVAHCGFHAYYLDDIQPPHPFLAPLIGEPIRIAEALIEPHKVSFPISAQLSLNIPPSTEVPMRPHLDGLAHPSLRARGRPGTFTLLVGILLGDESNKDSGNLWVWPGTHILNAEYLRQNGSDALQLVAPYPPTKLGTPVQIVGKAGSVIFAHYLLGHHMGPNVSNNVRRAVYFRLRSGFHKPHWQDCVQNELLEFGPVEKALKNS